MKLDHEHAEEIEMGNTGARSSTGIASTSIEDSGEGKDSSNAIEADIAARFLT